MDRNGMIEALVAALARSGQAPTPARRRLWQMSTPALEREMLLRGLADYDDPSQPEDEEGFDASASAYSLLSASGVPLHLE